MIDTHCHLIDPQFKNDLVAVLERAKKNGIIIMVNAGYDILTSHMTLELYNKYPVLKPAVGIHPNEVAAENLKEIDRIAELAEDKRVVAIGETGLDYYRDRSPRDAQIELFKAHIEIAQRCHKPLLIHTRNSIDDTIEILTHMDGHYGVFHCYSGSFDQACQILDLGYYLGFGGVLTFSKNHRDILTKVPIDRILLESDAPFLAPHGYRGKRNEPSFIIETLRTAAGLLDMSVKDLEDQVDANANLLFKFGQHRV